MEWLAEEILEEHLGFAEALGTYVTAAMAKLAGSADVE